MQVAKCRCGQPATHSIQMPMPHAGTQVIAVPAVVKGLFCQDCAELFCAEHNNTPYQYRLKEVQES